MSKRITIVLTDEEYAALEARARADRRSVRDMAARLVTQPPTVLTVPTIAPVVQPWNPVWPPNVWSGGTTADPNRGTFTTWNRNTCAAAPGLPINITSRMTDA